MVGKHVLSSKAAAVAKPLYRGHHYRIGPFADQHRGANMASIGIYGAKTHLPELLERVARGERITITRGGQPMAVLGPADPPRPREVATTLAALAD
ncbi:MAG: type II toxin-antitoxin system prevent-host-death family antitoxin, partial [Candidatus Competibacteraceae bacterium]|nr:type II toxin-antitoxin system prevent-host-death family antitoxin [Candidatus Competibacteraceae bacterium]